MPVTPAEISRNIRAGASSEETGNRRRSTMAGAIAWLGAATWATQLTTWAYMIVVARILTPADYGLIGMAKIPLEFLTVATEFGVANAIIMLPDVSQHQIAQLNTVAVISGVALFGVSCFGAHLLGLFFKTPDLPPVFVALSLALVITSFRTIPEALLQRECRFNLLAKIQAAQAIVYGSTAVISAAMGARYWSLVIASLLGVTFGTLLVIRCRSHEFAWPKITSLREILVFSSQVFGRRVAWFYNCNIDFAVVGRVLGKAALGSYNLAWLIAEQPQQKFSDLVTRVVPPYFSKVQNDRAALRQYLLSISQAISLVVVPATVGLALTADDFVAVALGPKWVNAVVPLQLLALYSALRSHTSFFAPLLNVTGQSRFVMWNHIWAAVYFTPLLYFATQWGIVGVAMVWPLLYPVLAVPLYLRAFKQTDLCWASYWEAVRPAVSSVIPMTIGLLVLRNVLPLDFGSYARLASEVFTGALLYIVTLVLAHRGALERVVSTLRPSRS